MRFAARDVTLATLRRLGTILIAFLAASGSARADGDVTTVQVPPLVVPPPQTSRVPDASLRAVKDRVVRLELEGAPAVEGRLLGFEDAWVTIARSVTNEVVSVPREHVLRLVIVDSSAAPVTPASALLNSAQATAPERIRIVGLGF